AEQPPPALASLHGERTSAERDGDGGRGQPRLVRGHRHRAGSGPTGERLADPALPDAYLHVAVGDPSELDVRSLGEQLVMLECRPDVLEVVPIRILVH